MTGESGTIKIYFQRAEEMVELGPATEPVNLGVVTLSDSGVKEEGISGLSERMYSLSFTANVAAREVKRFYKKLRVIFYIRGGQHKLLRDMPFYRKFSSDALRIPKSVGRQHTKFNRNVRPKGTHSHFRFYR